MKKLLLLFAALLQTVLVMAQNPVKRAMPAQKPAIHTQQQNLKNGTVSAPKSNRPWIIVGDQEDMLRQDRVPAPPGPNDPMPIIIYQYK